MTTATENLTMDYLTTEITAFPSWERFEFAIVEHKYCPTLRTNPKEKSKAGMRRNYLTMILMRRLVQRGYPVFFNGKQH